MGYSVKQLDRRCSVLSPTTTRDDSGGPVVAYVIDKTIWCRRDDAGGREVRTSDALRSESDCVFTFRWFATLTSEQRILCEGRTYDITSPPSEVGRRQFWRVEASERQGQA